MKAISICLVTTLVLNTYSLASLEAQPNTTAVARNDGVDFAFTTRFARYVNDGISIIVLMNMGEDEAALMPTRMTNNIAAIYIPSLKPVAAPPPSTTDAK